MKKTLLATLMAAALLAAACGGGDGDGDGRQRPRGAGERKSVGRRLHHLPEELVASAADMLEPVDTTNVVGPTDETSEPRRSLTERSAWWASACHA